jgi:hypothetical protein
MPDRRPGRRRRAARGRQTVRPAAGPHARVGQLATRRARARGKTARGGGAGRGEAGRGSINLVSTCRDEICRPFTEQLDRAWGPSFNISSLAGFCFCGRTGFKSAMAHAPVVDGVGRCVPDGKKRT